MLQLKGKGGYQTKDVLLPFSTQVKKIILNINQYRIKYYFIQYLNLCLNILHQIHNKIKLKLLFIAINNLFCSYSTKIILNINQILRSLHQDSMDFTHLRYENEELKIKQKRYCKIIENLQQEIRYLKQRLSLYEPLINISPIIKPIKKMEVEEHFESSGDEAIEIEQDFSPIKKPNLKNDVLFYSTNHSNEQTLSNHQRQYKGTLKKIIYNSEEQFSRKPIDKILKKSKSRNKDQLQTNNSSKKNQIETKSLSTKNLPFDQSIIFKRRQSYPIKSQKTIFRKVSFSKPIYQTFFVTGINKQQPIVTYFYPKESNHFSAILSLFYSQHSLKQPQLNSACSKSKTKLNTMLSQSTTNYAYIRDMFILPLRKQKGEIRSNERQYLIACEVEEQILERQYAGWSFPRYYCFISEWNFFIEFKKLISQFLDKINNRKKQQVETLTEKGLEQIIKRQLEQALAFLHRKNTDENKTLNFNIDKSNIKFSIDIPPSQNSYKLTQQYKPWNILNFGVQIKFRAEEQLQQETKLMGILTIYILAEIKIILYSNSKSKISEALVHAFEIIKPISYVNPIMIATLKQEHCDYIDAPMSIILGLWAEQAQLKKPNKQKIEILMNKKLNLMGLIDKAKLDIPDGIVINLDTGLIFGGGLNLELNKLGRRFNNYWEKQCKSSRDLFQVIDKLINNKCKSNEMKQIWSSILPFIKKTQHYCYYLEKNSID